MITLAGIVEGAEVEVGGQLGYYIYSSKDDGDLDTKGRKGKM